MAVAKEWETSRAYHVQKYISAAKSVEMINTRTAASATVAVVVCRIIERLEWLVHLYLDRIYDTFSAHGRLFSSCSTVAQCKCAFDAQSHSASAPSPFRG